MGNSGSSPDDDDENLDPFDGIDTIGYRVLGVQPNSPASRAGLVSFLDFLVGAQDQMLLGSGEGLQPGEEYNDVDLPAMLNEHKDQEMEFLVFNIKSQEARLVKLTPSDNWGGAGLLGVTIRLDNYAGAEDRLVRVLSVEPQSPAAICGLVPQKDFILGTTHQTLDSAAALAQMLQQHQDQVVELYVYNTDADLVRVVALMPTLEWGGGGLLGAEIGTGYLHRLPSSARSTPGASVERKVRYVAVNHRPSSSSDDPSPAADAPTLLEVEPQLEMEAADDDDDDDDSDGVVDVLKEVTKKKVAQEQKDAAAASPKEETSLETVKQASPPAAIETSEPALVSETPAAIKTPQRPPINEAEALFQSPPSDAMLPPPKMSTV